MKCKSCGESFEFKVNKENDILNLKCSCCDTEKFNTNRVYNKGNMRLNSKIYVMYCKLRDNDLLSDDFNEYWQFKKCLLDSGYKPWYCIERINNNAKFSLSNIRLYCKRTQSNKISFLNMRTSCKSCNVLESSLLDLKDAFKDFESKLKQFSDNDYIDSHTVNRIIHKANVVQNSIKDLDKIFKELNIKFK